MAISEVWINSSDTRFRQLLYAEERVRMAVLLFNEDVNYLPVVLLLGKTKWRAFLPVYIDYIVRVFARRRDKKVWLSSDGVGCVITADGCLPAYISEFRLSDLVITQIDSIWRSLNEICRYRP
jgi:hypothetical protein